MIKIIFLLILYTIIIFNLDIYSKYILKKELRKQKKDIHKFEKYYKLCNKGILTNTNHFQQSNNPKISIILIYLSLSQKFLFGLKMKWGNHKKIKFYV